MSSRSQKGGRSLLRYILTCNHRPPFTPSHHYRLLLFPSSSLACRYHLLTFVARELYPYGMKLNSIDGMRVGGKFMTEDGSIPEGQGTVHALLAECYELLHELRSEMEEDD